ncbi:MAG: inositol oxygenase family protein [Verrucomicrobiota bacterium]|jgi:inositol oxygenase
MSTPSDTPSEPMDNQVMEEWDEFVKERYPEPPKTSSAAEDPTDFNPTDPNKKEEAFRNYAETVRPSVRRFYEENHTKQTYDFVREKKGTFTQFNRKKMGIWEAAEYLNTLVDDSDPDTNLSQLQHLLQTSEEIRKDGRPRWMILSGFIHDLGKILCLYGEPQWAVVGDTFPVGCAFSDKIVFPEFFDKNPDRNNPELNTKFGVYEENCGLDAVNLSWGHDEYIYQVAKPYLPIEGLYMLRYHSFYPWHREGEYDHLCNDTDREMLKWVLDFNKYDLYTKSHTAPDPVALKPYYEDLIAEFFPDKLDW